MATKNQTSKDINKAETLKIHIHTADGAHHDIKAEVSLLDATTTSVKYSVVIEEEAISLVLNDKLSTIAKTAKVQGFRPGKIPLKVVESKFKPNAMKDTLNFLIDRSITKVIMEKKINALTEPSIEVKHFSGEKLDYTIKLEIFPEIQMPELNKISLEKPTFKIDDKAIKETLEKIANSNKSYSPAEKAHKAKIGDTIVIDFAGKIKGELFDGGSAKGHKLELGSKSFIDNFEEQLVGSKAGDKKTVKVKFPQDYHAKEFAGKPAEFEVTIQQILQATIPEINDELAKKFTLKDLAELKSKIKEQLESEYNKIVETKMRKELFDILDQKCKFDIPETLVKKEFETLWQKALEMKKADPNFSDKNEKDLKKEYNQIAIRRVKLGLLLAELGKQEKVEISNNELQQAVIEQARMYPGREREIIEYYQKNPAAIEYLKGPILEEKVVKNIYGKIKLSEKNYSLDNLKKAAQFD